MNQREYLVKASTPYATYTAGRFLASSPEEAIRQAQDAYRRSPLGRQLGDVRAFRFYVAAREDQDADR